MPMTRETLWAVLCLGLCLGLCRAQDVDDVDELLADVFGKPTAKPEVQDNLVGCTCTPYHNCRRDASTTPTTGENTPPGSEDELYGKDQIDIRIDPDDPSAECKHYLDKCCYPVDETITNPPPGPGPSTPTGPGSNPSPGPGPTPTPRPSPRPPRPTPSYNHTNECGVRHPDGVSFRITGNTDHEANYGEFPWMVAVIRRDRILADVTIKVMECGGSIIHPQVILTGAHCVKGKKDLYIRAGEWDTQTEKELYPTQDRDVKQVILHEGYYAGGLHNDVALLVLERPLELSPVVGTLCVPEPGESMDGRNCVVSGWGKNVFGKEGVYQVILKRVEQPVVPRGPCQEALRKTRLGQRFRLHESFMCAGGVVGEDACKGDGGSPLACPSKKDPRIYVQAGIVAWGIGCGTETPAVYVNVPHLRPWIDNKMATLHLS